MSKITGYKGFDKDFKCRDMQYEVGKTFTADKAVICREGLHFCTNPIDVLNYYPITESRYAIVSTDEELIVGSDGDSKKCTTKLKIEKELTLKEFFEIVVTSQLVSSGDDSKLVSSGNDSKLASSGNDSKLASSGNDSKLASSGNSSQLASSGNCSKLVSSGNSSQLASSGNSSQLASSGNSSQLASSGNSSQLASSGNCSKLAASGYCSQLASSGNSSQLASSGDYSKLVSSGDYSKLEVLGKNSVACAIGYNSIAKGVVGNWLVLADYKKDGENNIVVNNVKCFKVDGEIIKENTFYKLVDGEPVAIED